jgi:hypothetical protein
MTDDPFYKPGHRTVPRQPKPGTPLWSVHVAGVTWTAELRMHGKSGVETPFTQKPL